MCVACRGAFHSGMGPLDAQCKLLVHMLELSYDGVDVSNAISVIEALAILVHQHIASQEKVSAVYPHRGFSCLSLYYSKNSGV